MASIGVVNADTPKTQDPMNTTDRPKKYYFGVFPEGSTDTLVEASPSTTGMDGMTKTTSNGPSLTEGSGSSVQETHSSASAARNKHFVLIRLIHPRLQILPYPVEAVVAPRSR